MSCPIFAAILPKSDLGVRGVSLFCRKPLVGDERRRRDSAGLLEDREDIEDTAAWNSLVLSTAIVELQLLSSLWEPRIYLACQAAISLD